MTQEFVNYNQALALKELGFDEPCLAFFQVENFENKPCGVDDKDEYIRTGFATCKNSEIPKHYTSSPLKQQVFRWFRDKHNIQGYIYPLTVKGYKNGRIFTNYIYSIKDLYKDIIESDPVNEEFENYGEAESACIDKLIEIVKKQIV
jgi:hypothetical protein